jgi:hypothetical protein
MPRSAEANRCLAVLQALTRITGIESARPAGAIAAFRRQFQPYQSVPEARDFFELSRT